MECQKSCGAVVVHGGKLLLVRDITSQKWGLPMGEPNDNETEEQTATREILEETGLKVRIVPGFRETAKFNYVRNGVPAKKQMIIFIAEADSPNHKRDPAEIKDIAWFSINDIISLDCYDETKQIIQKATKHL